MSTICAMIAVLLLCIDAYSIVALIVGLIAVISFILAIISAFILGRKVNGKVVWQQSNSKTIQKRIK